MIPKIIHQIWIGDKKMPLSWMATWRQKNPDFKYRLWREADINLLLQNSNNLEVYESFYNRKIYHGAADVARVEILKNDGGIYVDADSVALEPIANAPFLDSEVTFFAAYDHLVHGYPGRITNGVIGAEPNHPILIDYVNRIGLMGVTSQPWKTVGGKLLTECIARHGVDATVRLLPAWTFWPDNWDGRKIKPSGKVYAQQMWGTSLDLYKDKL